MVAHVAHTHKDTHTGRISLLYEIPEGDEVRSGRRGPERREGNKVACRPEGGIAKIPPFVIRQTRRTRRMKMWPVEREMGETKRTSTGEPDDVRCGEGGCLFYGVEAKTYDIVLGKVAGFYFRDPGFLHPSRAFLSLPFRSYISSPGFPRTA